MAAAAVPTTQAMLAFARNLLADMHDMTRSLTGSPTATSPCASPTLRAASTMSPASLDASRAALEALHGAIADTVDSAALRVASVYLAAAAEAAAAEVGGTAMRVRECMLAAHEQVQVLGEAEGGAQPMQVRAVMENLLRGLGADAVSAILAMRAPVEDDCKANVAAAVVTAPVVAVMAE